MFYLLISNFDVSIKKLFGKNIQKLLIYGKVSLKNLFGEALKMTNRKVLHIKNTFIDTDNCCFVHRNNKMSEEQGSDLPFRAEYAKSGRAKCKGCKSEIPKGDCRLASLTQVMVDFNINQGRCLSFFQKIVNIFGHIIPHKKEKLKLSRNLGQISSTEQYLK